PVPLATSEPKILGAVTLGRAPTRTDTSPSGPVLVMEGVKDFTGRVDVLPMGWKVMIDPPSPCKKIFCMTSLLRMPWVLKVSTAVIGAPTAPRAPLLGWVMFPVPL